MAARGELSSPGARNGKKGTTVKFVISEILNPLLRRAGTAFGVYLVAQGVDQNTATQIAAGAVAAGGVLFDLLNSHFNRKGKLTW